MGTRRDCNSADHVQHHQHERPDCADRAGHTEFVPPSIWQAGGFDLDGDVDYQADFGALQTPGTYTLQLPELGVSSPQFVIATNVYQKLFRDTLRYFYYQRATVAITNPYAESYTRVACHPEATNAGYNYAAADGHFNFGTKTNRNAGGCWFDAGDTHVDVPNTATACWFLLETAKDFGTNVPAYSLDLPESTAGQSDLVPLIYNALNWLGLMQATNDGSECHYIRVQSNNNKEQVSDISSMATACAAGTFAKAYTILGPSLTPAQSGVLLSNALLEWSWLQANTNMMQPRLPLSGGVDGGGWDTSWGDSNFDNACRAYAAVELFIATGQAVYNNYFISQFNANGDTTLDGPVFGADQGGWGDDNVITYLSTASPLNLVFMDYACCTNAGVNTNIRTILKDAFLNQANCLTNYTACSDYRIPMLYPYNLYWGSHRQRRGPFRRGSGPRLSMDRQRRLPHGRRPGLALHLRTQPCQSCFSQRLRTKLPVQHGLLFPMVDQSSRATSRYRRSQHQLRGFRRACRDPSLEMPH